MINSIKIRVLVSLLTLFSFTAVLADIQSIEEVNSSFVPIPSIALPNLEQALSQLDTINSAPKSIHSLRENHSDLSLQALIAKLSSEIQIDSDEYINHPRIGFINSLTTDEQDARYLDTIASKLQKMGTKNIPDGVLQKGIQKRVVVSIRLDKQGHLLNSIINSSSEVKALDLAALDIVKSAAPYQPIPQQMSDQYDQVNIVRTFLFDGGK